jgi:hypothetical protein
MPSSLNPVERLSAAYFDKTLYELRTGMKVPSESQLAASSQKTTTSSSSSASSQKTTTSSSSSKSSFSSSASSPLSLLKQVLVNKGGEGINAYFDKILYEGKTGTTVTSESQLAASSQKTTTSSSSSASSQKTTTSSSSSFSSPTSGLLAGKSEAEIEAIKEKLAAGNPGGMPLSTPTKLQTHLEAMENRMKKDSRFKNLVPAEDESDPNTYYTLEEYKTELMRKYSKAEEDKQKYLKAEQDFASSIDPIRQYLSGDDKFSLMTGLLIYTPGTELIKASNIRQSSIISSFEEYQNALLKDINRLSEYDPKTQVVVPPEGTPYLKLPYAGAEYYGEYMREIAGNRGGKTGCYGVWFCFYTS